MFLRGGCLNLIPSKIGIVVGIGVGITRDCTIVMIAQYFKKKRELVEILTVAASGLGILVMSTFQQKSIDALGWRYELCICFTVPFQFQLGAKRQRGLKYIYEKCLYAYKRV